jgi:hypothetical protein
MGEDSTAANTDAMDHAPANNNNQGRGGFGRGGHGGGRNRVRRGGRNGGRNNNGGRGTGSGWQGFPQWAMPWGTPWRAPWTGATGLGVMGSHPPAMGGQEYPAFQQPMMTAAPLQASSWDTTGLLQVLHATSMQQPGANSNWYMDTGASSHMTSDQGKLIKYYPSLLHNSSSIVVGNGSRILIFGTGSANIHTPTVNFLLASVLHTPNLVFNLISVGKFTRDNWCSVEFDPFGFSVKDLIHRKVIMRSNSDGDLYPFANSSI